MDDARIVIRPATRADFVTFYGHGLPMSCRALAVDFDGELAAVAGITVGRSVIMAFSDINPQVKASKIMVWRTALKIWERLKSYGYREIMAVASPKEATSIDFLIRLGFRHVQTTHQGEVFKWAIQ